MFTIDYFIIFIPLLIVIYAGLKSQKYVRGVSDFISAGRVAGRYVVSVAQGEAGMGLISAVAILEMYYKCGFAVSFWSSLTAPISLVMGLVGFCTYRFRETKCMTVGQFFEIRYSKSFRVVAAVIQSFSGIVNYAIFPAVGARFLIYFLKLPLHINIFGWACPTFALTMLFCLGIALLIALAGGQVTIMVTDCVQGLLSYPMYLLVVFYIWYRFSWTGEMVPALMARPAGESFLNPYDISQLRDFNLFYVLVGIFSLFTSRMSWGGSMGYFGAAKSAHEAKMGGLLGTWRGGFSVLIFILIAVASITYVNHEHFAKESRIVRSELATKAIEDVLFGEKYDATREKLIKTYEAIPERTAFSKTYASAEEFKKETADPYIGATVAELEKFAKENDDPQVKKAAQTFSTIFNQMLVPVAIREILPAGITGLFAALMIFLMVSTDTTYMHSWGSIVIQDIVVPLRKNAFTPEGQIRALRWSITGVCIFAFLFSMFFAQIDYILMFFAITGAIWAGAGIVITLGLYWSRGTTAGAYTSLLCGAIIAVSGILAQQFWASHIYPWLVSAELVEAVGAFLQAASKPLNPYVVWQMNPLKFPINSTEIGFMATISSMALYVIVSLLTCKKPFNMDRMLRRGKYSDDAEVKAKEPFSIVKFLNLKILGIDSQYTTGDKILAWSVFLYSFGYGFVACFVLVVVWNYFTPWSMEWWGHYFFIKNLLVAGIIGLISTVWFSICGTIDLVQLFKDLDAKQDDVLDDGRVVGHVSAADAARMAKIDSESADKE